MNVQLFRAFLRCTALVAGCGTTLSLAAATTLAQAPACESAPCECDACREFLQGCAPSVTDSSVQPFAAEAEGTGAAPVAPGTSPESSGAPSLTNPSAPDMDFSGAGAGAANNQPSLSSLASSSGSGIGDANIPSMIGDFFGGGFNYAVFNNATVATAGGDRRMKLAENNSPFPRDRVFFNYHHFHNAVINLRGEDVDLDRYTFGWEKTFLNDQMSFEIRAPLVGSVGSNPLGSDSTGRETEFGNLSLVTKALLYRDATTAWSTGLAIVLPTGDDFIVGDNGDSGGTPDNIFKNDAVHLQPFVGLFHASSSRAFHQAFLQFDFDTAGNEVQFGSTTGVLNDATLMFVDYSFGYWLQRDYSRRYFRGLAPMVEMHYTTTVTDQDYGPFEQQGVFVLDPRRDVLNITGGLFFELTKLSTLKIGAVAPLRDGPDKLFDTEIGVQFTRLY